MKIVHIVPSAGSSYYCQNCLRDLVLVRALRDLGHESLVVPMYLPLASDRPEVRTDSDIFYGAIGVYLKEKAPFFSRAPRWIQRLLDSRRLLDRVSRKSGATRSRDLADITVSVLSGEDGRQAAELDRLVDWLGREGAPDIVHLSNALIIGLARRIKNALDVPVVCSLQDELNWIDAMEEKDAARVWTAVAARAGDVDIFASVSRSYADEMTPRLNVDPKVVKVVPIGIELDDLEPRPAAVDPPAIGYMSRICESLGAGLVTEAFIKLKETGRFNSLKLRLTGGYTDADVPFIRGLRRRLSRPGFADDVEFVSDFSRAGRIRFLRSVTVMSVPALQGEAQGMHLLEAMAAGVPIVQPKLGGFRELIDATGGGVLYETNDADTLAEAVGGLLLDPERTRMLADRGMESVRRQFNSRETASRMLEIYDMLTKGSAGR